RRDRLSDQALLEPTTQRAGSRLPHARTEALSGRAGWVRIFFSLPLYPLRSCRCLRESWCPLALRMLLRLRMLLPLRPFLSLRFFLALRLLLAPAAAPVRGAPDLRQLVLSDHQPGHRRRFDRLGELRILRRIRPHRRRKAKETCGGGNEAVTPQTHRSLWPHHRHPRQDVGQRPPPVDRHSSLERLAEIAGPMPTRIGHSIVSYRSRHGIERQACRNAGKIANF